MEAFLHTRINNAKSEGIKRVIKFVGRAAYGFRNPTNQRPEHAASPPAEPRTPPHRITSKTPSTDPIDLIGPLTSINAHAGSWTWEHGTQHGDAPDEAAGTRRSVSRRPSPTPLSRRSWRLSSSGGACRSRSAR
ncbi:transposase [Streptomyces umbrinus]|uniref:transposase n=1 Tax=Streptomyces umbrinus TaxID=67370 RepID=UPI003593EBF7